MWALPKQKGVSSVAKSPLSELRGGAAWDLMVPITANKANEIPRLLLNSEGITVQGHGGHPNIDPNIYDP